MKANVQPAGPPWDREYAYELLDYTLFQYGLVRGDVVTVSLDGTPHYAELGLYDLGGILRLGIPYFERTTVWTRLSGLVAASRAEFTVSPEQRSALIRVGHVTAVVKSALRGVG